jgi:hypothetical protein
MPIRLLIDNRKNSYLAIDATILVDAFEGALEELELVDRHNSATRLVVANHIITLAKAGEGDPVRLRDLILKAIGREQRQPLPPRRARFRAAGEATCHGPDLKR